MAFIGTGSEWFWTAISGVVLAVTFIAIYRQLRLQRRAGLSLLDESFLARELPTVIASIQGRIRIEEALRTVIMRRRTPRRHRCPRPTWAEHGRRRSFSRGRLLSHFASGTTSLRGGRMRLWPFGRKPRREHSLGEYTEPSFRGAILMLVISVGVVALLWLAYSWALSQPNVHDPNGAVDRVTGLIAVLRLR